MTYGRQRTEVQMRRDRRARGPVAAKRELWWRRSDEDSQAVARLRMNQSDA